MIFCQNALRDRAALISRVRFPLSLTQLSLLLIYTLLTELSSKYKMELGTEPNLSRNLVLSPNLPMAIGETPALFIGGGGYRGHPSGHGQRGRLGPQHLLSYNGPTPD